MTQFVALGETPLRLSPPGHQRLERAESLALTADGTESNAAVAAHALGTQAVWLSKLTDSPIGRRVQTAIDAQGVETDVTWVENGKQGLLFDESSVSPRQGRQVNRRENAAMASATPSNLPMNRVQQAEMLCTGLSTSVLSQKVAETATALLRAGSGAGGRTVVAFDYDPTLAERTVYQGVFEELSEHTDVVVGTERGIQGVLNTDGNKRELASTLAFDYDLNIAAVVEPGNDGVVIEDTGGSSLAHERDGLPSQTVDPTGEFGAIVGGFAHALLRGGDGASALDTGLAAGALARTIDGPFLQTTPDEFDGVLDQIQTSSSGSRY